MADKRFLCSGGRLSGCVSESIFFLRDVSVEWRAKLRGGRGCDDLLASRAEGDSGRCAVVAAVAAFLEGEREAEDLVGDLVGEADPGAGAVTGVCWGSMGGSSGSSSSSSTALGFLEPFLEKNFIEVDSAGLKRRLTWVRIDLCGWWSAKISNGDAAVTSTQGQALYCRRCIKPIFAGKRRRAVPGGKVAVRPRGPRC